MGEKKVDDGELILYFYGLKRKGTSIYDLDANVNYWQNFENDLRLKANLDYTGTINAGSLASSDHTLKPDFYLYKKWEDSLLTLAGKYNFNVKKDNIAGKGNIKMVYDHTITDDLKSNLTLLYSSQDATDQPIDHLLRPEWH